MYQQTFSSSEFSQTFFFITIIQSSRYRIFEMVLLFVFLMFFLIYAFRNIFDTPILAIQFGSEHTGTQSMAYFYISLP